MRKEDARAAVAELQLAIRLNPRNADAYGTLAHALNKQRNSTIPHVGQSTSVEAAERAVALESRVRDVPGHAWSLSLHT